MRSLLICIAMFFAQQATAAVTINLNEDSGNVQAVMSGSLNLDATGGFAGNSTGFNGYLAASGNISFTNDNSDYYAIDVGTWAPFGSGTFGTWDTSSGDAWHMFSDPVIGVPVGYVSGSPLSATATKNGSTFATLGFTPGIYVTTLTGSGGTDTVTVNVGGAPTPPVITSPPDGAAVIVEGQASDPFVPMWSASSDPQGDTLTYTWELWTPGPGVLLLSVPTGTATQADLTMGAVAGLLAANGVAIGGNIDLVHRAVVTDGTSVVPGPTAAVNLTLGDLEPTPPVITSPPDGAAVIVEGQASDPFVPMWSASVDPEGAALEYTWELWTPGPGVLLLSVPTGTATQADLTMGAVAGLLAANGVAIGGNIDLVHRAVVTDGANVIPGPTAAVNLTLGDLEPTPPVITSPPDGATVVVEGEPSTPFVPMWSASIDPEGDTLTYTWELWTPGPGVLLLSVPTGTATQADLTMGAVNALLVESGVLVGESIDLVHRAVVTDGTNIVAGETADVTLQLGYVGFEPIPTMGQLGSTILILLMAMAGFAGYRRLHV